MSPKAETKLPSKHDVFRFLEDAFQVQVSLSELPRTKEEIGSLLNPYFSNDYQRIFLAENLFEEEGKYLTYGSDFPLLYVPFFQYSEETKVIYDDNRIYVFEYFPASTEGPVGYESHYEGLLLKKVDGTWKVDQYLYNDIPKSILDKEKYSTRKQKQSFFSLIHFHKLFY